MQVMQNMLSFADSRVSIICHGVLFSLAVLASLWLSFFSVNVIHSVAYLQAHALCILCV